MDVRDNLSFNVKVIDCTGYPVDGAVGYMEGDEPRLVRTPWFEEPIPFAQAAEVGTEKVVTDHSTIGIVVTTDGSIVDLPRESYVEAEKKIVEQLLGLGKPFVIVLNCRDPYSKEVSDLATQMEGEYGVPVIPANCQELNHDDVTLIMEQVLYEFPVKDMTVRVPKWVQLLSSSHWLRSEIESDIKDAAASVKRVRDIDACVMMLQLRITCRVVVERSICRQGPRLALSFGRRVHEGYEREDGATVVDVDILNIVGDLVVAKKDVRQDAAGPKGTGRDRLRDCGAHLKRYGVRRTRDGEAGAKLRG